MINLYLIEDDQTKVRLFPTIVKMINQNESLSCRSGFEMNDLNGAYKNYDLIFKAIRDESGFWLLDIFLQESREVGMKLYENFIKGDTELEGQVARLEEIFGRNIADTYLACVLSVILTKLNRPFDFISNTRVLSFVEVRDILNFFHRDNIPYPDILDPNEDRLTSTARAIAISIRRGLVPLHQIFLDRIFSFNMEDLHISEKKIFQYSEDFLPIESLSSFLGYASLEDFNSDFPLWKNFSEKSSYTPNLFEEMLKSMSSRNFSLFAILISSWSAFRSLSFSTSEEMEKGDSIYKNAVKLIIKKYQNSKSEKNKDFNYWEQFVRHVSVWPPKSRKGFIDTLGAFLEMMRILLYNPETRNSNLRGIVPYPRAVKFHLDINGERLIQRLNSKNFNLLEVIKGESLTDKHQSSRKIMRYFLLSQLSTMESIDGDGTDEMNTYQWGSDSGFFITNRSINDENQGITLNFTI